MAQVSNTRRSPFLAGVYAPVDDELEVAELAVTGEIPGALRGTFVRNGPNPMFEPKGRYHIFDGDGMLHAVSLDEGRASYRNRWIRSAGLMAEIGARRALYGGMADADFPGPDVVGDAGPMKNVANTHVIRHAGRILALWEAGPPTEVTPELATVGPFDFGGRLLGAMTAHPKIDPDSGELLFFGYSALPPFLRYYVVDAAGELTRHVDLELPAPVMMHDFVVTAEHVVFLDAPAVFDLEGFAAGGEMLSWRPELGARLGVMPRDGDARDVVWCEVDPCYVFHFLNAWTEGSHVHVDACRMEDMDIGLGDGPPPEGANGRLGRFTVDLGSGTASWEQLDDLPSDFPRIDDRRAGRRHRYGYVGAITGPSTGFGAFDAVVRHDLERGERAVCSFGAGHVVGEPVFAPDPGGTADDDGWLVSFVYDAEHDTSDVVVLDARDVAGGPVARIHMPRRVPFGFHGSWFPAEP